MTRYPLPDKLVCYTLDLDEDHAGYVQDFFESLDKLEKLINFISEKKNICFIFCSREGD